jgi:hypothetical protein
MFAISFSLRRKTKIVSYFAAAVGIALLALVSLTVAIKFNS